MHGFNIPTVSYSMEKQQERRNVGEKEDGQSRTGPESKEHRTGIQISPTVEKWNGLLKKSEKWTQSRSHS